MTWWLLVVAVIAAVPAAAWLGQERLIFFPQPLAGTSHLPDRVEPLDVRAADGTKLAGFFVPASATPAPVLLFFGGNAEEISWTLADARWPPGFARAGVNYRGYGASEGSPAEAPLAEDAKAVFDAIARRPDVDPARIVVVGRSLGTGVAARLAAERPVRAAILVSPYDSLVEVGKAHYPWLPVRWLLKHRFDAASYARQANVPLLAIVGTADAVVHVPRSRALFDAWSGPKTWVAIEGGNHNDLNGDPAFWAAVERFASAAAARVSGP
ncbi:MAG TPA: alpha/beta hydrolase [Casimicrobiaceae bacterium]|nr:alpha/beta hydrolase [Casimicrobiaceae bacterium]